MPTPDAVTQLSRPIGTADAPLVIDIRTDEGHAANPSALPASIRRDYQTIATSAKTYTGRSVTVLCTQGAS